MKSLLLLVLSVLVIGCPEQQEPTKALSTPKPLQTVVAANPTSEAYFSLRLSSGASPGWFEITAKNELEIAWDGGQVQMLMTSDQAKTLANLSARAVPDIQEDSSAPPYRVLSLHKGDSVTSVSLGTPKGGSLDELARLLESFLPAEPGLFQHHAVGILGHRDLEGGFYEVTYSKDGTTENVVLHGSVPAELKGQLVLVTGTSSEGEMSLEMAGPTFEVDQVVAWPPTGGYWQEGGIPEGLLEKP